MPSESVGLLSSLSHRDQALLYAVAGHRVEILPSWQPVLIVDGRMCCDSDAGRRLIEAGLLAQPGLGTGRWPARLTSRGEAALARVEQVARN